MTSSSQQDESAGDLDSTNAARPESSKVSWPRTEEPVPDDSEDPAVPMDAGLVGAALQGSFRKKERMTTMPGELLTGAQEAANEQTSREPSPDEKEAPPNAA